MIQVLIADSHPVVREGLAVILAKEPDITVVGEAQDGVEALDLVNSTNPDVLLMELNLPRLNGLGVLRNLNMQSARVKVILFTGSESKEDFMEAVKLNCARPYSATPGRSHSARPRSTRVPPRPAAPGMRGWRR